MVFNQIVQGVLFNALKNITKDLLPHILNARKDNLLSFPQHLFSQNPY